MGGESAPTYDGAEKLSGGLNDSLSTLDATETVTVAVYPRANATARSFTETTTAVVVRSWRYHGVTVDAQQSERSLRVTVTREQVRRLVALEGVERIGTVDDGPSVRRSVPNHDPTKFSERLRYRLATLEANETTSVTVSLGPGQSDPSAEEIEGHVESLRVYHVDGEQYVSAEVTRAQSYRLTALDVVERVDVVGTASPDTNESASDGPDRAW